MNHDSLNKIGNRATNSSSCKWRIDNTVILSKLRRQFFKL